MINRSGKRKGSSGTETQNNQFLFQQYQVLSGDRINHNDLFWNIPNIFLLAQSFLLSMAIGSDVPSPWQRAVGAFISFVFGFISIQIFERNRISEISDAELMQDIEKHVLSQGFSGTEAHQKISSRKYLNGGNVEKNLESKGFLKFFNRGVSYELWKHGMWLVTIISGLLFLYNTCVYFSKNFPYLDAAKTFPKGSSITNFFSCLSCGSFQDFINSLDKSAVATVLLLVFCTWLLHMLYRIYLTYPQKILFRKKEERKINHVILYSCFEALIILLCACHSINLVITMHQPKVNVWLIAFLFCFLPMFFSVVSLFFITIAKRKAKEKESSKGLDNNNPTVIAVILAGGESLRLQNNYPNINKFLNVVMGDQTLLEATINRNWKFITNQAIVTTREYSGTVTKLLEEKYLIQRDDVKTKQEDIKAGCKDIDYQAYSKEKDTRKKRNKTVKKTIQIFTEPVPKGTATAIYYYLWRTRDKSVNQSADNCDNPPENDPIMIILPSDHVIPDLDSYTESIRKACSLARDFPNMYLLGLKPSCDSKLYGHIVVDHSIASVIHVKEFKEKPELNEIATLKKKGMIFWNMGIFVARRSVFLALFKEIDWPNYTTFSACNPCDEVDRLKDYYVDLADSSFDKDILQKASIENLYVIPTSFNWIDVGDPDRLQAAIGDTLCKINKKAYDPSSAIAAS